MTNCNGLFTPTDEFEQMLRDGIVEVDEPFFPNTREQN
jgi:hypothetical protein